MSHSLLIATLMVGMLTGCLQAGKGNPTRTLSTDGLEPSAVQITHDCFASLSPVGPLVQDQYAAASASVGACVGDGIELSSMIRVSKVSFVAHDGSIQFSHFYADGQKVNIKSGSQYFLVGTFKETNRGNELVLAEGVQYKANEGSITLEFNWGN